MEGHIHLQHSVHSPKHFGHNVGLGCRLKGIKGDGAEDLSFPTAEQRGPMESMKGVHITLNCSELIKISAITSVINIADKNKALLPSPKLPNLSSTN